MFKEKKNLQFLVHESICCFVEVQKDILQFNIIFKLVMIIDKMVVWKLKDHFFL